jgi:hypothetical protein
MPRAMPPQSRERPPNDGVEDLVEIKREIEGALASMLDAK